MAEKDEDLSSLISHFKCTTLEDKSNSGRINIMVNIFWFPNFEYKSYSHNVH